MAMDQILLLARGEHFDDGSSRDIRSNVFRQTGRSRIRVDEENEVRGVWGRWREESGDLFRLFVLLPEQRHDAPKSETLQSPKSTATASPFMEQDPCPSLTHHQLHHQDAFLSPSTSSHVSASQHIFTHQSSSTLLRYTASTSTNNKPASWIVLRRYVVSLHQPRHVASSTTSARQRLPLLPPAV